MKDKLFNLDPREYEHEFDKKALSAFKAIPGSETITKELLKIFYEKQMRLIFKSQYILLQKDVFPEIYNIVEKNAFFFSVPFPEVYIEYNENINAYTFGSEQPLIVMTSGCIEKLDLEELDFIIAHEMGHIHNKHVIYHFVANSIVELSGVTPIAGILISSVLRDALLYWSRMSEFTADRAGFLATGKLDPIYRAFIKMSGFPKNMYNRININSYKRQCDNFTEYSYDFLANLFKTLTIMKSSHPWNVIRIKEIEKWSISEDYRMILDRSKLKTILEEEANSLKNKISGNVSKVLDNLSTKVKFNNTKPLKQCKNCGNNIDSSSLFCPNCGFKQENC